MESGSWTVQQEGVGGKKKGKGERGDALTSSKNLLGGGSGKYEDTEFTSLRDSC